MHSITVNPTLDTDLSEVITQINTPNLGDFMYTGEKLYRMSLSLIVTDRHFNIFRISVYCSNERFFQNEKMKPNFSGKK